MSNINKLKVDFIDKETMCRFDELNKVIVIFDCNESLIRAFYKDGELLKELEIKVK